MEVAAQEIWELLQRSNDIIITSHVHPDGDAIGSSLAMYHVLRSLGKKATVLIDDHVPECYSVLPGIQAIRRPGGEGETPDLLLLLDARMGRSGRVMEHIQAPVLNIDHHASNDGTADYVFLDADSSSTCEILYRMFKEWGIPFTKEIAMNLYVGIATDTGFFRFENTTASSLEAAAELVRLGAEPNLLADALATKNFRDIRRMAKALQTAELFHDGQAVGVFLDRSLKDLELTDELIDMIRFTEGVDIAFLLKYEAENIYRVRMRSRFSDVSKLMKPFGGGGHAHAAGCTLCMTLEEAKRVVVKSFRNARELDMRTWEGKSSCSRDESE